jgi:hypothetical protein
VSLSLLGTRIPISLIVEIPIFFHSLIVFSAAAMSSDQNELVIQVIGCMVEVLADDDGNINQKCFDKIFTACIKAVIVAMKVGDQALAAMQQALDQVQ